MNDKLGAKGLQIFLAVVTAFAAASMVVLAENAELVSGLLSTVLIWAAIAMGAQLGWGFGRFLNRKIDGGRSV